MQRTQRITVDLGEGQAVEPGAIFVKWPICDVEDGIYMVVDVLPEGSGISAGDEEDA